jgi:hypothetical protein
MKLATHTGFVTKKQAALAFLALTTMVPAFAQQATKAGDRPVRSIVEPEEKEVRQLPQPSVGTGITVHGHWVLDLRDKDGTLIEHRDFHNSLTSSGALFLPAILGGRAIGVGMGVFALGGSDRYQLYPSNVNLFASQCQSLTVANTTVICIPGLSASYAASSSTPNVTLSGQLTAAHAESIGLVGTLLGLCANIGVDAPVGITGTACAASANAAPGSGSGVLEFTSAGLTTPLSMTAGQVLTISVTISFS